MSNIRQCIVNPFPFSFFSFFIPAVIASTDAQLSIITFSNSSLFYLPFAICLDGSAFPYAHAHPLQIIPISDDAHMCAIITHYTLPSLHSLLPLFHPLLLLLIIFSSSFCLFCSVFVKTKEKIHTNLCIMHTVCIQN